eukprot:TRINITY_DN4067_c5_g1_i1.p1 TRINITY_DN4067_c5_g1~~TRINITY_DN4067_c5_g1_i1.p1  ORF type:complete len:1194 (+),score=355.64 TRINITY_DN4067_c5_g1_i1:57-3584(+)
MRALLLPLLLLPALARAAADPDWAEVKGLRCGPGHGAAYIGEQGAAKASAGECKDSCSAQPDCEGVVVQDDGSSVKCWLAVEMQTPQCETSAGFTTHFRKSSDYFDTKDTVGAVVTDGSATPAPADDATSNEVVWQPSEIANWDPYNSSDPVCADEGGKLLCKMKVLKREPVVIDFSRWQNFRGPDKVKVSLDLGHVETPLRGTLFGSDGGKQEVMWHDAFNKWTYEPDDDAEMEAAGADDVVNVVYTDTVPFRAESINSTGSKATRLGTLVVVVYDAPPRTPDVVFKCLDGNPRDVVLRAMDVFSGTRLNSTGASLWVRAPATAKQGTIYTYDGDSRNAVEPGEQVEISGEWRVYYSPENYTSEHARRVADNDHQLRPELGRFSYHLDEHGNLTGTVIMQYQRENRPQVYSSHYLFHDQDEPHVIELLSSQSGPAELFLTLVPSGELYQESETQPGRPGARITACGEPANRTVRKEPSLWCNLGTTTGRRVLLLKPPKANGGRHNLRLCFKVRRNSTHHKELWSEEAEVTFAVGENRPPICEATTLPPVFLHQEPVRVSLKYLDPDRDQIARLILMKVPSNPLGYLAQRMRVSVRAPGNSTQGDKALTKDTFIPLRVWDSFYDTDESLYYVQREEAELGDYEGMREEEFWFSAEDVLGEQCKDTYVNPEEPRPEERLTTIGKLTVRVLRHDLSQSDVNRLVADEHVTVPSNASVRAERAVLGQYLLLPLWGEANKTVQPKAAEILTTPHLGKLYAVLPHAVYEPSVSYADYCVRRDCEVVRGDEIGPNGAVQPVTMKGKTPSSAGAPRPELLVLYRADVLSGDEAAANTSFDSFRYVFVDGEKKSAPEETLLYLAPPQLEEKVIWYSPHDTMIVVPVLDVPQSQQQCRVQEYAEDLRLHAQERNYYLFQYDTNGTSGYEAKLGARLDGPLGMTWRHNHRGLWVAKDNTVIVQPRAGFVNSIFRFRVSVYEPYGNGSSWIEVKQLRIVVAKRIEPPRPFSNALHIPEHSRVRSIRVVLKAALSVEDRAAFVLTSMPQFGYLQVDTKRGQRSGLKLLRTVSRNERLASDSPEGDSLTLWYRVKRSVRGPENDSFTFRVFGTGTALLSAEQGVIKIGVPTRVPRTSTTKSALGYFGLVLSLGLTSGVVVFFLRRHLGGGGGSASHTRHRRLPTTEPA